MLCTLYKVMSFFNLELIINQFILVFYSIRCKFNITVFNLNVFLNFKTFLQYIDTFYKLRSKTLAYKLDKI